jgi:hypothetical protein
VGLKVSVPPVPFLAGGKTNLVYELDLTNYSWVDMQVERLDVLDGDKTIANFAGYELSNILTRPRLAVGEDHRVLPVGGHVVAFLWLSLDPAKPAPSHLRHRIVVGQRSLEGGEVAVSTVTLKSLGPPLRGSDWLVGNGFANDLLSHRRSFLVVEGKTFIAQRFAIDWQKLDAKGRAAAGPDNKDFFGYGNEVLAVSDGIIAEIKDGIPQNIPGPTRAAPMTIETIAGNHILLDLGDNRFALYAHLQPGSLRVSVGDRVRKGTVLGLVGNSGNSGGPHLHFHITDGPSPFASEGVPYALEEFEVLGGSDPGVRRNEAPLNGELIRFSESK